MWYWSDSLIVEKNHLKSDHSTESVMVEIPKVCYFQKKKIETQRSTCVFGINLNIRFALCTDFKWIFLVFFPSTKWLQAVLIYILCSTLTFGETGFQLSIAQQRWVICCCLFRNDLSKNKYFFLVKGVIEMCPRVPTVLPPAVPNISLLKVKIDTGAKQPRRCMCQSFCH